MTDEKEVEMTTGDGRESSTGKTEASAGQPGSDPSARPDETKQPVAAEKAAELETPEAATGDAESEDKVEQKEATVEEQLQERVDELEDKLLRTAAEFENFKKRVARQYSDMVRSANDDIISEFLEVVDSFDRALRHSDSNSADFDAFRKGIGLIFNRMSDLLERRGISPIEAQGKPFDPNLHEAMMQVESDEYDESIVAVEISKGYRMGNRVLRHSKVGVSKGKKHSSEHGKSQPDSEGEVEREDTE